MVAAVAVAVAVAVAALDPDAGLFDAEIDRRRDVSLVRRRDGMFALTGC